MLKDVILFDLSYLHKLFLVYYIQTGAIDESNFPDLFKLRDPDAKDWPEASLLNPIYKVAPNVEKVFPFVPRYGHDFESWLSSCSRAYNNGLAIDKDCPHDT